MNRCKLDPLNRQLIRRFVDVLIGEGETQLCLSLITKMPCLHYHRLEFVPRVSTPIDKPLR